MAIPASLLEALHHTESEALTAVATSSPSEATPTVRDFADSKLLSLTPAALTTLEGLLDASDAKVKHAAAVAILDRSPATKPTLTVGAQAGITLPPAAVTALFEGLASILSSAGAALPPPSAPPTVVDATIISEENP